MRLLHTADEHVDSEVYSTIDPRTGRNTAWTSNAAVVSHLALQAVELGVDAFVSAGDEFRNGKPSQEALLMLADAYTPIAEAGIPMLLLDGNHNLIGVPAGHRTVVATLAEILRARGGDVQVASEPGLVRLGSVDVVALPWMDRNRTLAGRNVAPDEADHLVAEHAMRELARLAKSAPGDVPLIMAGHVSVTGRVGGSERDLTHLFSEPVLSTDALSDLPFSYGALGHIHTPHQVGDSVFHYAGSPNRLTFTDEGESKGGNLVTIDENGELHVERIVTPARRFLTIDLAVDDPAEGLSEGDTVRVVLRDGETEVPKHVREMIRRGGARLVRAERRKRVHERKQRSSLAQSTSPEDALRGWAAEHTTVDPDVLITAARRLA